MRYKQEVRVFIIVILADMSQEELQRAKEAAELRRQQNMERAEKLRRQHQETVRDIHADLSLQKAYNAQTLRDEIQTAEQQRYQTGIHSRQLRTDHALNTRTTQMQSTRSARDTLAQQRIHQTAEMKQAKKQHSTQRQLFDELQHTKNIMLHDSVRGLRHAREESISAMRNQRSVSAQRTRVERNVCVPVVACLL